MMGTPFMAEIRIMSFNFAPKGWAQCNGQVLPINQNQALFSIMGTMYGGNGQTTFALPNLQGCAPIHQGQGFLEGQRAGEENHTLISSEMPAHNHFVDASNTAANQNNPAAHVFAQASFPFYNAAGGNLTTLNPLSITNTGGSQAHTNMQPYLVLNFCIALQGIFPSRN
jgi:microcystin-dependent protein